MTHIVRVALVLCLLLAPVCAAQTAVTSPAGWTSQGAGGPIIFTSPGSEAARPALTLFPPARPQGNAKNWFGDQVLAVAKALGKTDLTGVFCTSGSEREFHSGGTLAWRRRGTNRNRS